MNVIANYLSRLWRETVAHWNRFFFTPSDPSVLAAIRIAAGSMLLYTHLVWSLNFLDFFGPQAWIQPEVASLRLGPFASSAWSFFWLSNNPTVLWAINLAALASFACVALGLFTRVSCVLAFLFAVSYVNRTPGALFGLDQLNVMLITYLMLGNSGDAFSLDRWLAARRAAAPLPIAPKSTSTTIAIRLIQLHMCVIYFFAGLSKLQGTYWWTGEALWMGFANYEYQSIDMTWLADYPLIFALLTTVTVYWELFFPFIIWPRLTRALVLAFAIPLHLGIGICMGMMTFGLIMLVGCASFITRSDE